MLTKTLPLNIILCTFIITLTWLLFQATSDLKWSIHREVLTPLYCHYLDTLDQITASIALWRLVAVEMYRTVLYLILPSNQLKMAY